jgi:hypothetical protein
VYSVYNVKKRERRRNAIVFKKIKKMLILFACILSLVSSYYDEDGSIIWVTSIDESIRVNGRAVLFDSAHRVLNHFYEEGYDIIGHAMSDHKDKTYSWTLAKRRK